MPYLCNAIRKGTSDVGKVLIPYIATETMTNNVNTLANEIATIATATDVQLSYVSEEKLPKKLGLGIVTKIVKGKFELNHSYEDKVNDQLESQGATRSFKSQSLPWGTWLVQNLLISHKGETYLRYYGIDGEIPETTYFVNGKPATQTELTTILTYKKGHKKSVFTQTASGVTKEVVARCVNLNNILSLTCENVDYKNVA